jgi:hypothetical protein
VARKRSRARREPESKTKSEKPQVSPALLRRTRLVRRIGYGFFGGVVLYLVVPMIVSIIGQLQHGGARDPFNDAQVSQIREACVNWSEQLHAQRAPGSVPWDVEVRAWRWRCANLVETTPE